MKITVSKARKEDAGMLVALGSKTFFEKWKNTTSRENMNRYLAENYSTGKIESEISDASIIYLVAHEGESMVGFARLKFADPDIEIPEPGISFTTNKPLEISRLYVSPELIGKSIGGVLIEKIFEVADEKNCDLIWLGVWENNPAVRFYQRHGFVKAGTHKFVLGDQVDTDWVMVKRITLKGR